MFQLSVLAVVSVIYLRDPRLSAVLFDATEKETFLFAQYWHSTTLQRITTLCIAMRCINWLI